MAGLWGNGEVQRSREVGLRKALLQEKLVIRLSLAFEKGFGAN